MDTRVPANVAQAETAAEGNVRPRADDDATIRLSDSRTIVRGVTQFVDAAVVLAVGWLALLAEPSHSSQEWRFGVLIVALGPVLQVRILESLGDYEFSALERWTTGAARSTVACCLTLLALCFVLWLTVSSYASSRSWLEPW